MVRDSTIVVVGSGLIGRSWAVIFAKSGWHVLMYDAVPGVAQQCVQQHIRPAIEQLKAADLLGPSPVGVSSSASPGEAAAGHVDGVLQRISACGSLQEAVWDPSVSMVIEAVPEVREVKEQVFAELARIVAANEQLASSAPPHIVLASSSSNLPPSAFTAALPDDIRARVVGTHPVNPPTAVPVVELIPSEHTHPEVLARAQQVMAAVGMAPVTVRREVPGFVVNRLQYALLGEAVRLVMDGVASPEDVDTAVTHGLGARWCFMGPFQTIDLNAPGGVGDYCDRYAAPLLEVLRTQDNTRDWTPEVRAQLQEWARARTPVERIPDACRWRDRRLLQLAALRASARPFPELGYRVDRRPLVTPPLADVAPVLSAALERLFARVAVAVERCPDLTEHPWCLARPGFGGRPVLVDAGGAYNIERVAGHARTLNTQSIASAIGRLGALAIGPAAACREVVGVNAELAVNDDTGSGAAASFSSRIDEAGERWEQAPYASHAVGPLANLLLCDGAAQADVLHVRCERWLDGNVANRSFVGAVRAALADGFEGALGAGGVVRIGGEGAKIRAHVMPDWSACDLDTPEKVNDWLRFFEMDAPVTAVATLATQDLDLGLRPHHTHFFSEHGACGHYHYDTTPEAVVYDAYFVLADAVYRVERPLEEA